MKIVLVALYDIRSYGIRIIHALLEQNGFDVTSIFFHENMERDKYYNEAELDLLVDTIKQQGPDIVGIGVRSPLFQLYKKITKKIKNKMSCIVIAGGHHATITPEDFINCADIVCRGEGEYPTLELCETISKNESIEDIKNLWIIKNDKIIKNDIRPLIEDLDSVPFPSFSRHNQIYIQNGVIKPDNEAFYDHTSFMAVITTRGCFFDCSYCYNSTLKRIYKGKGKYVRRRSVQNVIEELMMIKETFPNLSYIFLSDNVFTYGKKWINAFCDLYSKEIGLPFGCFGHFLFMNIEILKKLKNTGLSDITYGIQSASHYISTEIYNRKIPMNSIVNGSKLLSKLNISAYYDLITNNPYETDLTHKETLDILLKLEGKYRLRNFKMKYYPKVPLTQMLLKDKIISEKDIESNHEGSFELWKEDIDLSSKKEQKELYWDCLYYMVQVKFPKLIIKIILKSKCVRRHPKIIAFPLKYLVKRLFFIIRIISKIGKYLLAGDLKGLISHSIKKIKGMKDLGFGY